MKTQFEWAVVTHSLLHAGRTMVQQMIRRSKYKEILQKVSPLSIQCSLAYSQ